MIKNENNGVVTYAFNNLTRAEGCRHLFSTRVGGVSEEQFASMNLSFTRGDNSACVMDNFKRIAALGFPIEQMVFSNQVHGTEIQHVSASDCGKGILTESDIIGVDGLMTSEPNVVLVTFYADCVPLYFFDPIKKAIALSHAGWRGTLAEIGRITVEQMQEKFGSNPRDILVGIGPSICKNCFEVSRETADMFAENLVYSSAFTNGRFIDLWGINKQTLLRAGVLERNIELPNLCTKCNPDVFYSHRAMGAERGSMAAFLSIQ